MAPFSPDAFSPLDDSVVIRIFKLLGEPKTRTRLLTVCRRFRNLVAEAGALEWTFASEEDIERCGEYIARHRLVCRSLKYEFTCTKGCKDWCRCPELDARAISGAAIPAAWETLEELHLRNPLDKALQMTRFGLMLNNYQNLRCIDVCGVGVRGFRLHKSFQNLTTLVLDCVKDVDLSIFDNISNLSCLETLKFSTAYMHGPPYKFNILSGSLLHIEWGVPNSVFLACPSLLTLDARLCNDVRVDDTLPSLKTLSIDTANLGRFFTAVPQLEQLLIWVVDKTKATDLVHIHEIDEDDSNQAFRIDLVNLHRQFRRLKVLTVVN